MVKHLTQCQKSLKSKQTPLAGAGVNDSVGSLKRHVWHSQERYEGVNAVQSPTLVDWDPCTGGPFQL